MERFDDEWIAMLREEAEKDESFFTLHMQLCKQEARFNKLMQLLPPEQRRTVLEFVQINQRMEVWLINHSHQSGIQVGQRRAKKKGNP